MINHHKFTTIGAVATLSLSLVGATSVPAAFAAPATDTTAVAPVADTSHTYDDGATITFPSSWTVGQELSFTGTGFNAKDGSPSTLALKINGGGISAQPYLRVEADTNGNVTGTIPWQEGLKPGQAVTLTVLTGSLNQQDPRRGGDAATVRIQPATPSALPTAVSALTKTAPTPSSSAISSTVEAPVASPSISSAVTRKPQPSATPSQSEKVSDTSEQDSSPVEQHIPNASANAEHLAAAAQGSAALAGSVPKNCTEASARGLSNIDTNSPHYGKHLDRDNDGVGCESKSPSTPASTPSVDKDDQTVAASESSTGSQLNNCTEARARGLNNIEADSEYYDSRLDRDKDGVGCESKVSGSTGNSYSGGSASRVFSSGTVAASGGTGSYSVASATRGKLANTGASGSIAVAGVGLLTLIVGTAIVLVARRRKQA